MTRFRIDDVVRDFRDALVAIAPVLVRTGIDVGVDDDWDRISEALFDSIVLSPVRASFDPQQLAFGKYAFVVEDDTSRPYFVVRDEGRPGQRYIFFDIAPRETRFDTVRALVETDSTTRVEIPWSRVSFSLRVAERDDDLQEMTYC